MLGFVAGQPPFGAFAVCKGISMDLQTPVTTDLGTDCKFAVNRIRVLGLLRALEEVGDEELARRVRLSLRSGTIALGCSNWDCGLLDWFKTWGVEPSYCFQMGVTRFEYYPATDAIADNVSAISFAGYSKGLRRLGIAAGGVR